jgi:hypothetical protein
VTKRKVVLTISCHLTQHRRKTITPSTTFLPVKFRIESRAAQKEQVRPLLARMRRVGPANGERSTATGGHRICTVIRRHRCFWKTTPLSFVTGDLGALVTGLHPRRGGVTTQKKNSFTAAGLHPRPRGRGS